nr:hypothetical protein [Tanacetum cinerariifolium]
VEHKDTKKSNEMYYPRNSDAYKEYYAFATGATPPKTKASIRKTKSSSDTTITPPLTPATGPRLDESDEEISWKSSDEEGDDDDDDDEGDDGDDGKEGNDDDDDEQDDDDQEDEGDDDEDDQEEGSDDEQAYDKDDDEFIHPNLSTHDEEETRDEETFDPIPKTPDNTDDEGNGIESIFETTSQMDVLTPTLVAPLPVSAPTLTPATIATVTTIQQAPTPLTTARSTLLQDLPNFSSLFGFDHRLKTLEANFSEFMKTNQFAGAVSSILGIVQRYVDQRMNEAVKVAVQIQFERLCDEAQVENDEFLKTIDENMQKIIKEQVKEQVKVQVSKILPKIEQTVNEQLEAEVLTRSSNSLKTSYVVAVDLSEMELKKILIEKMEGNKSIHRSNEQRNLYKALRRRDDDADKDKEPSAGSDWGSKRRREGKEPESASTPKEKAARSIQEPIGYDKHALWGISHWGRKRQQFYSFAINRESAREVYSKRRIIAVTELKIVEWRNYKHLDWITVRKDDDKLYKFKEGDFKRLRIQDIEDMLLLLHRNPKACGRPSTRFRKLPEEAQPNKAGYVPDGTLTDVRTTLDDRLKGIQMKYLPQSIRKKSDKDRATTMI